MGSKKVWRALWLVLPAIALAITAAVIGCGVTGGNNFSAHADGGAVIKICDFAGVVWCEDASGMRRDLDPAREYENVEYSKIYFYTEDGEYEISIGGGDFEALTTDGITAYCIGGLSVTVRRTPRTVTVVFESFSGCEKVLEVTTGKRLYDVPDAEVKEGSAFLFWRKDGESAAFDFASRSIDSSIRFLAVYEQNVYTVRFDNLGGYPEFTEFKLRHGEEICIPTTAPVKPGFVFKGYSAVPVRALEDIIIFAEYEVITVSVIYKDMSQRIFAETVANYGARPEHPDSAPVAFGYTFVSWVREDGALDDYAVLTSDRVYIPVFKLNEYTVSFFNAVRELVLSVIVKHGDSISDFPDIPCPPGAEVKFWHTSGGQYSGGAITADTDLFAAIGNYTVFLAPENGDLLPCCYGDSVSPVPDTVDGFLFLGWFLDAALSVPYGGVAIGCAGEIIRLFPKFVKDSCLVNIIFPELVYGDIVLTPQNVSFVCAYGEALNLSVPVIRGHSFLGFFTDNGLLFNNSFADSDITLFARYSRDVISVSFHFGALNEKSVVLSLPFGAPIQAPVVFDEEFARFLCFDNFRPGIRAEINNTHFFAVYEQLFHKIFLLDDIVFFSGLFALHEQPDIIVDKDGFIFTGFAVSDISDRQIRYSALFEQVSFDITAVSDSGAEVLTIDSPKAGDVAWLKVSVKDGYELVSVVSDVTFLKNQGDFILFVMPHRNVRFSVTTTPLLVEADLSLNIDSLKLTADAPVNTNGILTKIVVTEIPVSNADCDRLQSLTGYRLNSQSAFDVTQYADSFPFEFAPDAPLAVRLFLPDFNDEDIGNIVVVCLAANGSVSIPALKIQRHDLGVTLNFDAALNGDYFVCIAKSKLAAASVVIAVETVALVVAGFTVYFVLRKLRTSRALRKYRM